MFYFLFLYYNLIIKFEGLRSMPSPFSRNYGKEEQLETAIHCTVFLSDAELHQVKP
jgi:hypothetical protein